MVALGRGHGCGHAGLVCGRQPGAGRRAENTAPGISAGGRMSVPIETRTLALPAGAMCYDAQSIKDPGQFLFDPNSAQLGAVAVAPGGRQAAWFVRSEAHTSELQS